MAYNFNLNSNLHTSAYQDQKEARHWNPYKLRTTLDWLYDDLTSNRDRIQLILCQLEKNQKDRNYMKNII